jgi:uncharacterized membrane protein
MGTALLFVLFFGLVLTVAAMRRELDSLKMRVLELEGQAGDFVTVQPVTQATPDPTPIPPDITNNIAAKTTGRRVATIVSKEIPTPIATPDPVIVQDISVPQTEYNDVPSARSVSFESLMGAKLPIWVGGISLVFAAFFLVRYSIEAGLFGPVARSISATLFALLLILLSEFGSKLPRIGSSFADDPRVAQSLAGAGVASLYATLYMASEIYGLVVLPMSFLLVIAVTALAFVLSVRRGPPTAVMGVIGGFAAPWVAGMGASSVPTLLLYLGVFMAAIFGLALWRRWLWLLLLASGGGTLWTLSLITMADNALPMIGLFVMLAGAGAVFAVGRFGTVEGPLAQVALYAPMGLALVQLAMLLPRLQFSFYGWAQYGALGALAVVLAWRDAKLLPLYAMAVLVAITPLFVAWNAQGSITVLSLATVGYALLFGVPGYWRARCNEPVAHHWGLIGLAAPVFAYFVPFAAAFDRWDDTVWGLIAAVLAVPPAYLSWLYRNDNVHPRSIVLIAAAAVSALMTGTALVLVISPDWIGTAVIALAMAVAAWAKPTASRGVARVAILPLVAGTSVSAVYSFDLASALLSTLWGQIGVYATLPGFKDLLLHTMIPSVLAIVLARAPVFAPGRKTAKAIFGFGAAGLAACAWYFAKQPLAITTAADFIRYGFAERMMITQILFASGFVAIHFSKTLRDPDFWVKVGMALAVIALARVAYFDLLILNPVLRAQELGPAPIANLGTINMAATAVWLWLLSRSEAVAEQSAQAPKTIFISSLGAAILTSLITVRQMAQGSLVSGAGIETGENYLYSVALLLLALAWLARGIISGAALLRVVGLGLLTAVTFKVFLIDAAALTGILRILSFLGLGIALIGIGWAYGLLTKRQEIKPPETS